MYLTKPPSFLIATALVASALLVACGGGASAPPAATQTISFNPASTGNVGTPITLSATASSGLSVSFSTSTSSVCTVSGTTLTLLSTGTCTVNADQAGNGAYAAASQVSKQITVSPASIILATGFNSNGTTTNGGIWANGASWGNFSPSSANTGLSGFGGGGWEQNPPVTTGGYVYFGEYTPGQITDGYLDLYFTIPTPVTINGQSSIKIPLAISAKWATQASNKTISVIITNAWDSANNCNNAVKATLSNVTSTLTDYVIPLSQFTAVPVNTCTQTAAQTLAAPIASIHVQTSGTNFNTTATDDGSSNYATGFTIGSPVQFQ